MNDEALYGSAVYNPALLSRAELKRNFVARAPLLERIVSDLRREQPGHSPQHRLILGLRGMGKTMLLHRISLAVEEDDTLTQSWLPLTFPEEQYNIDTLADLWLNTLDALGDRLELTSDREAAEALDEKIATVPKGASAAALDLLLAEADVRKKRLLLLIDNIDLVLDRLKTEHWALREILQSQPDILIIGTSANALEATYQYDAAFYDFFKVDELKGLSVDEMNATLKRLAEINEHPKVLSLLDQDPARIKTLHTLTGGNPRTTVLLFQVLAQGLDGGDVRSDLEGLLDRVTPLYKARFEELPEQAQKLMDALAIRWDPMTAKQLAERLGWQVNAVSAQLSRLEQQTLVEKTPPAQGKRSAFQIGERFFNIWYLMRASRRVRQKLIWLVRFLRMFFNSEELAHHARRHLRESRTDARGAEYALALAQTLENEPLRSALETQALDTLLDKTRIRDEVHRLLDFQDQDAELLPKFDRIRRLKEIREEVANALQAQKADLDVDKFCHLLLGSCAITLAEKSEVGRRSAQLTQQFWQDLNKILIEERCQWQNMFGSAIEPFCRAIASGDMAGPDDLDGARAAAERLDDAALPAISWCFARSANPLPSPAQANAIEESFCKLVEAHPTAHIWKELGNLRENFLQRYDEAEQAYRKAIEIDPKDPTAYNRLAWFFFQRRRHIPEAIELAAKAASLAPDNLYFAHTLATLLLHQEEWNKAAPLIERLLAEGTSDFHEAVWDDTLILFREAVRHEYADRAVDILDKTGAGHQWRPLREALVAIAKNDMQYLNGVAPEVRDPAAKIVAKLNVSSSGLP